MTKNEAITEMIDNVMRQCISLGVSGLISINGISRLIINNDDTQYIDQYKSLIDKISNDGFDREHYTVYDLVIKLINLFEDDSFFFDILPSGNRYTAKRNIEKIFDCYYQIFFTKIFKEGSNEEVDHFHLEIYEGANIDTSSKPLISWKIRIFEDVKNKNLQITIEDPSGCGIYVDSSTKIDFIDIISYIPLTADIEKDDKVLDVFKYIINYRKESKEKKDDYNVTSKFEVIKNGEIKL